MIVESAIPLAPATADPVHDTEWWAVESARLGSDWPGVIRTAVAMLSMAGLVAPEGRRQ
jgi:hypothetical protein